MAFLAYQLSWYVLPSLPKYGLNNYIFPLAVPISKGVRFALAPLYPGSLYARLDECARNVTQAMGRYDVVTHTDSSLYKCLSERMFQLLSLSYGVFRSNHGGGA